MKEKAIEHAIIRAAETLGFDVTKTSAALHARGVTAGTPDLYLRSDRYGIRLWAEVKTPKGRVSPHQQAWHERERACGGDVVVVRSVADLVGVLKERGVPLR